MSKYVIYAEILGVKKYITELVHGPNDKFIVGGYSLVPEEAMLFDNRVSDHTEFPLLISMIHNPQDRDFKVEAYEPVRRVGRPSSNETDRLS